MYRLILLPLCWAICTAVLCAPVEERAGEASGQRRVPVIIEISSQEVYYSRDRGQAFARGAVSVFIQRRDRPEQWVRMLSEEVVADLRGGTVDARRGVRIESERGVFTGTQVHVDASKEEFWLRGATAVADLAPQQGQPRSYAYLTGQNIAGKADVVYVMRGHITTCDLQKPHWAVEAREITFDTRTGRMRVRGGRVRLYGLTLPTLPSFNMSIGPGKEARRRILTALNYNSRDGIYSPASLSFTGSSRSTQLSTDFKLSSKRGLVGTLLAEHDGPRREWYALYQRRGDRYDNVSDYMELDRAPEVGFISHFIPKDSPRAERDVFDLTLSTGYFREKPRRYPPASAGKLHISLDRKFHVNQFEAQEGAWHGWSARWELYDDGQDFYALRLFAGGGCRISSRLAASVTVYHNFFGGETPLRLDDVDIRTELTPMLDWDISEKWRLRATARYDVDRADMRDYVLQLDRKQHCLTWYVRYREIGGALTFGVNLSGLTGDTRPYHAVREPEWLKPLQPDTGNTVNEAESAPQPSTHSETEAEGDTKPVVSSEESDSPHGPDGAASPPTGRSSP